MVIALLSCKERSSQDRHKQTDTNLINYPCAVIVMPTLYQIDSLKAAGDSTEFYVGADDYMYYTYTTQQYLDSVKCKTINRESKGILKFKLHHEKCIK